MFRLCAFILFLFYTKTYNKQHHKSCDDIVTNLNTLVTSCEKLDYFYNNPSLLCLDSFVDYLGDTTGHPASIALGTVGAYYPSDSAFERDLTIWRRFFDCNK